MTPMEAIQSATSIAARYMGWSDRVGALQPGLMGDLIAVTGIRSTTSVGCSRSR